MHTRVENAVWSLTKSELEVKFFCHKFVHVFITFSQKQQACNVGYQIFIDVLVKLYEKYMYAAFELSLFNGTEDAPNVEQF